MKLLMQRTLQKKKISKTGLEIDMSNTIDAVQSRIPLVIPAYKPDHKLLEFLERLREVQITEVILVDDGSGEDYSEIFRRAKEEFGCHIVKLYTNMGKGFALKMGFNQVLATYPDAVGCVTTDCNGSFFPEDILAVMEELSAYPTELILGTRVIRREDFTRAAWIGTRVLQISYHFLDGITVTDPQSGLHGIPFSYMEKLMHVYGNGYEFDTQILANCKKETVNVREVQCKTRYSSRLNASTKRNIKDNIPIYLSFAAYISTSMIATFLDIILFALFCGIFNNVSYLKDTQLYVALATGCARIFSSTVNYYLNYRLVFKQNSSQVASFSRWVILVIIQTAMSATAVSFLHGLLGGSEVMIKIPIDFALFFFSYYACRKFVYR